MILVVYRHRVAPGTEEAFVEAWKRCKSKMLGRARGFLEATILRDESDPSELVCVSRWETVDDWKRYWKDGVPDPEGERPRNEVLVELETIGRKPKETRGK